MPKAIHHFERELTHIAVRDAEGVVVVRPGVMGILPLPAGISDLDAADAYILKEFGCRNPTVGEREAASFGSAWGWMTQGADPRTWTENPARRSTRR